MSRYLDAIEAAAPRFPRRPHTRALRLVAALMPQMALLASEKADGVIPYLVTRADTRQMRATLGEGMLLAPEQAFMLEDDPLKARAAVRRHLRPYLAMENYRRSWRRLGFSDQDFENGGKRPLGRQGERALARASCAE